MSDANLLAQFVAAFGKLDTLVLWGEDEWLPPELDAGTDDSSWAHRMWKPALVQTSRDALAQIYDHLPATFPTLYEDLILSYRWLAVDLRGFASLFANPPGDGFSTLISKITADRAIVDVLFPLGFIPFAHASDGTYDMVCFDRSDRSKRRDCPVVRIEHEPILSDGKLGKSWQIADSFQSFVVSVVEKSQEPKNCCGD